MFHDPRDRTIAIGVWISFFSARCAAHTIANLGKIGEEIRSFGSVPGVDIGCAAHET